MDIYKVKKTNLKWNEEIKVVNYKWDLPILIDKDFNVLIGSSLRNNLGDDVLVIVVDNWHLLVESLFEIENAVSQEEDYMKWYSQSYYRLKQILKVETAKGEQVSLFEWKETGLITEDNYIKPAPYDFVKQKSTATKEVNPYEEMSEEELLAKLCGEEEEDADIYG